jgi:hypothetical protein
VWAHSAKRAARDNLTPTAQENRARDVVAGDKSARAPRFVTIRGDARALRSKPQTTPLARALLGCELFD